MATPSEVLAHAARVHNGTKFERARAGATTLSTFLQLSADDKRNLAVMVAQRVSPELVPRIQAESGVDLTPDQSRAVLDMISRLDGNDLKELSVSISTPEARRATLGAVTASAASGLDDVVAADAGPDEALAGRVVALEASLAAAETTMRNDKRSLEQARHSATEAEERAAHLEAQLRDAASKADIVRREHDTELDELRRQLRRATREVEESGGSSMSSLAIAARPAVMPGSVSAFDMMPSFDLGDVADALPSTVAGDTQGLPGDLPPGLAPGLTSGAAHGATASISDLVATLEAGSAAAALRTIRAWMPRLAQTSPAERARVLQAIPDGWARRRALQRMVEAGVATTGQDAGLLTLLERTGDQVFAAASMIDTGMSYPAVVAQVSSATRRRLERRTRA